MNQAAPVWVLLGGIVGRMGHVGLSPRHFRWLLVLGCLAAAVAQSSLLRRLSFSADPLFYAYLDVVGGLLCFTYAANALVRFRGTHDRLSLILAFGFVLASLIETGATFGFFRLSESGSWAETHVPLAWMVSRTLLALLLLAALFVERRLPHARDPDREIIGALVVVGAVAYCTSVVYLSWPYDPVIRPGALIPRPWELFPAALFLMATIGYWRRLRITASSFDRALCWAAGLNVACHLLVSQSQRLLDAPSTLGRLLQVASYAIVLGGALLDNARLFDQVRHLAISDSLTGLGNYRRLLEVLESEIYRSRRTGRPFALVLFDLDELKLVNDRYGHVVGSRALVRLGRILRVHCRAIDTAARYGGDEFALVLPEANREAAQTVMRRICDRLAADPELPRLSVSAGAAVFPQDGETIEKLLVAADTALYRMKRRGSELSRFSRIAACL